MATLPCNHWECLLYSPGQRLLPSLPVLLLLHELGLQLNVFCSQCLVGFSQFYHRVRESICMLLAFMKLGLQLGTDPLMVREELLDKVYIYAYGGGRVQLHILLGPYSMHVTS